jgi:hypothetical protein
VVRSDFNLTFHPIIVSRDEMSEEICVMSFARWSSSIGFGKGEWRIKVNFKPLIENEIFVSLDD